MDFQSKNRENPLASFMRQPKIYIRLPSNGQYWPTGSLEISETGEYPVYSMTAKDELLLKVPDAIMSGQAVIDVIQHCMPNIKNAWATPNIDLDTILIAIRIATYGERMTVPINIGEFSDEYEIDLRYVLNTLSEQVAWDEVVQITSELIIYVKPFDYKQISASAMTTFETQRVIEIATNSKMSEEEKAKSFKEAIEKLTNVTINLVNNSVYRIDTPQGYTDDLRHIKEFMENVDKSVFEKVKTHIEQLRENNSVKPMTVQPTPEMLEKGVPNEPIEIPLTFDPSTFFG